MTDAPDQESKTELASEKRIRDAVEKGNIPFSREATTLGSVAAILAGFAIVLEDMMTGLLEQLQGSFARSGKIILTNGADSRALLMDLASACGAIVLPFLIVLAAGGILGAVSQNMPSANLERLTPKAERISPSKNFQQLFGKHGLQDALMTTVKVLAASIVAFIVLRRVFQTVLTAGQVDPDVTIRSVHGHAIHILTAFAFLCLVIGIADLFSVRRSWAKKLMMTRQEVKDEFKQSEGDPHVKQRMKLLGRRRLNRSMMSNVPQATMVVVNPTHYAVAMRYAADEGGAPIVIAKGVDHLAKRIRELCEAHQIPVVENPPLARSLHKMVPVGAMIPPEFYKAVAEIVHFVELRKRLGR